MSAAKKTRNHSLQNMKTQHTHRAVSIAAAMATLFAMAVMKATAITLPVAEDTSTSVVRGSEVIREASGRSPLLNAAGAQRALIRFDYSNLPTDIEDRNINSVTMSLYTTLVRNASAGDLIVRRVTSAWSETSNNVPAPSVAPVPVATIPAASLVGKNFITVDITDAVLAELAAGTNFGFMIETTVSSTRVLFASKEGSLAGAAARLDFGANSLIANAGNDNLLAGVNAGANLAATASENTVFGQGALQSASDADGNVAIGFNALENNVSGDANVAVGFRALENSTGFFNVGLGAAAGAQVTNGSLNIHILNSGEPTDDTTIRIGALPHTRFFAGGIRGRTTGEANAVPVLIDSNGQLGTITLGTNIPLGNGALGSLSSGERNVGIGVNALNSLNTGSGNIAIGRNSLQTVVSGLTNTAVGDLALENAVGTGNIALGAGAGRNVTNGALNIMIGNSGEAADTTTIRIGTILQNRFFAAGIRGVTTGVANAINVVIDSNGQLGTVSSSARYKEDIRTMGAASQRLLTLRPVTFRYREAFADGQKPVQYGLIAEEVAAVFPELAVFDDAGRPETVKYQDLSVLLLNEFLQSEKRVEAQAKLLAEQQAELARMKQDFAALAAQTEQMARRLEAQDFRLVSREP
jgi:hypothetical protein